MARAVVPRTATAVDHADTELIGHDGQLGDTGFLCSGFKEMISRLCTYFPLPKEWQQAQWYEKGAIIIISYLPALKILDSIKTIL